MNVRKTSLESGAQPQKCKQLAFFGCEVEAVVEQDHGMISRRMYIAKVYENRLACFHD